MAYRLILVALFLALTRSLPVAADSATVGRDDHPAAPPAAAAAHPESPPEASTGGEIQVPPPPLSTDNFPCSDCHEPGDTNPTRRVLTEYHQEIVLRHDEKNRWCLDCHDEHNRDYLHLANGTLVPFERSYLLCGQCHGPILRSWKAGVHGKRTGRWDGGQRYYLLCVHCHYPHQPHFPKIAPMPPPIAPSDLRASLKRPIRPLVLDAHPIFSTAPGESDDESADGKPGSGDSEDANDAR